MQADERTTLETIKDSYENEQKHFEREAEIRRNALSQLRQQIDYESKLNTLQSKVTDNLKLLQEGVKQTFAQKTFKSAMTALEMVSNFIDENTAEMGISSLTIDEPTIRRKIRETEKKIDTALANAAIAKQVAGEAKAALDQLPATASTPKAFEWVAISLGKVAAAQQQRQDARDKKAAADAAKSNKGGNRDGTEKTTGGSTGTHRTGEVTVGEVDDPDVKIEIKSKD
ncbi:hypothetical protein ACCC96_25050 [Pseudomonas sp. Pseusp11]|uniref:hypothetical protein n=1 Tax=Pseudomonas sp. Pseusp11 TaxID=3243003 RepID=UPI0039B64CB8